MFDAQSIHLKALDSADLDRLRGVLNMICREADQPLRAPATQKIAALLISLYRHGVTDEDKLLSVSRRALAQRRIDNTTAVSDPVRQLEAE
ncbi:hypothetical protein RJJ65_25600 [Rhizobium hidalgonense]|uniref:Uncharacterized protein n=1 Tax=Rhizobium hidalgonense TaxID=1538159 RepID=A0A2A6K974_9HYPH|nr:hypothetical protein [Rhizobium hidalgonense]MDR9775976.1 hypothetical protein [Rhizobium hidalgonense]MDR9814131.1 hypothetical protein [Rhizobium hidalgonense]MDR9820785.1 hypothetical protein [Rhizobium hidalgonense]PDT20989.1 hypothetical protein CO674_25225 [Rhizobium hidalgonense]PON07221.1 hypothetical protein ATY29_12900 [Rhizobium hidalgonense]